MKISNQNGVVSKAHHAVLSYPSITQAPEEQG